VPRLLRSSSIFVGRRRVVTLAGDQRLFSRLLCYMDGSTAKRRAVRAGAKFLVASRMLQFVARRSSTEESNEIRELSEHLRDVAASLGNETAAVAVMWPISDRAHRRYITGLDSSGANPLFCKFSTKPELDADLFENEHAMLKTLHDRGIKGWRTPRSCGLRQSGGSISLVMEGLPGQRRHLTWDDILARLPLEQVELAESRSLRRANELDWYRAAELTPASAAFNRAAVRAALTPVSVSLVNGDVTPCNSVCAGTERWLYDWEFAHDAGPHQTDVVAVILNRSAMGKPGGARLIMVVREEALRRGITEVDLVMSLLYLSTLQHSGAMRVMAEWAEPNDADEDGGDNA